MYIKHEIVSCQRCKERFECKSNNITSCQCTAITLTPEESEWIIERYNDCLCIRCLIELKQKYNENCKAILFK